MKIFTKTHLSLAALALLGLAVGTPAHAQVGLFTFDTDAAGTATQFSDTSGGITATFSSPADPGGFLVTSNPAGTSVLLSGQVLTTNTGNTAGAPLNIAFSQNLAAVTLDFVDDGQVGQTFTLNAFENGTAVGTVTVPGFLAPGDLFAEGVIGFFGPAPFNSIQLSTATAPFFAIDNVGAVAAPVPEASTTASFGLLLTLGLGGLVVAAKRRKQNA